MANDDSLMASQKFIKVLTAFAEVCRSSTRDRIASVLTKRNTFVGHVNQKCTMSLAFVLLSKKQRAFEQLFLAALKQDFEAFDKAKYSRMLLTKLVELEDQDLKQDCAKVLYQVCFPSLLKRRTKVLLLYFYVYISIELLGTSGREKAIQLLKRSDMNRHISGLTLKKGTSGKSSLNFYSGKGTHS